MKDQEEVALEPRCTRPRVHRRHTRAGRAGLSLAFHALGGVLSRIGFGLLALGTLGAAVQSWRYMRARNVRQHREWMLRSYGLISPG